MYGAYCTVEMYSAYGTLEMYCAYSISKNIVHIAPKK